MCFVFGTRRNILVFVVLDIYFLQCNSNNDNANYNQYHHTAFSANTGITPALKFCMNGWMQLIPRAKVMPSLALITEDLDVRKLGGGSGKLRAERNAACDLAGRAQSFDCDQHQPFAKKLLLLHGGIGCGSWLHLSTTGAFAPSQPSSQQQESDTSLSAHALRGGGKKSTSRRKTRSIHNWQAKHKRPGENPLQVLRHFRPFASIRHCAAPSRGAPWRPHGSS